MKNCKLPDVAKVPFPEFVGVLLGDGHLGPRTYEVSVTGDSLTDIPYVKEYIPRVIETLFDIMPFVYKQAGPKNVIRCKFNRKRVFNFLVNDVGLPAGRKRGNKNAKIPYDIFNNAESLKACLRGLFDTDGGFHRHHPHTAMIELYSRNPSFLKQVEEALRYLQFRISVDKKSVQIYCRDEIDRFFSEVGCNNPKNLIKYKMWKVNGEVPINQGIQHLLVRPWSSLVKEFSANRLGPSIEI